MDVGNVGGFFSACHLVFICDASQIHSAALLPGWTQLASLFEKTHTKIVKVLLFFLMPLLGLASYCLWYRDDDHNFDEANFMMHESCDLRHSSSFRHQLWWVVYNEYEHRAFSFCLSPTLYSSEYRSTHTSWCLHADISTSVLLVTSGTLQVSFLFHKEMMETIRTVLEKVCLLLVFPRVQAGKRRHPNL